MHIGVQLIAPEGTPSLCSGRTFYLFSNGAQRLHTTLAWFERQKHEWRAHLIRLPKDEFEAALLEGHLKVASKQATLPPWLVRLEGIQMDSLEDGRVSKEKTYRARATERYESISFLLTDSESLAIDLSDSPQKHILERIKSPGVSDRPNGAI